MMAAAPGAYLEKVALFQQRFEATIADHQSKQTTSLNQKQVNPVEVHVRQRPRNAREEKDVKLFQTCFTSCNETILYYPSFQVLTDPAVDVHKFEFDGNHGVNTGQNSFYLAACKDLWSTVESGGIFTLFAYGQTGSGKTHTVMGVCNNMVNELPFITHDISIQLLEVIGDVVRCLNTQKSLRVLIDPKGTPVLQGDSKFINVRTIEDAKIAIDLGFKSRKTVGTFKNDTSSRSHFICRILMTHKSTNIVSEVKLVDLAGSERNSDSANHSSERVKESVYINKSLMSLKSCIRQRSSTAKTAERVPCRASKLTLLLKDVLDPSHSRPVKLVMVATLSPTIADVAHSLDTFRYAAAMKGLPSVNAAPVELNLNPLKWIQVELSHWFETQSKNRVSLKTLVLDDLKPASPTDFVMPAWKHIYDIDECLFVKRCSALSADEARQLRFAYKSLFLKKRASTKSTLVTHEYAIETLLALEMPRRKPVQGAKSRAELALEKLSAKGKAARASAKPSR